MSMKTEFGGMAIAASTHLLYCVVMAVFAQYLAAMRYVRCLRWIFRFDHATICLAFAFLFSGAVGSMAQQGPAADFSGLELNFDSKDPFSVYIEFNEPVRNFDRADITVAHTAKPGVVVPAGCEPTISTLQQSTNSDNRQRYTFTVTPKAPLDISFTVGRNYEDLDGNPPVLTSPSPKITKYNGSGTYAVPVANAGPNQLKVDPGATVTLAGSGTTDDCLRSIAGYAWTRTSGTADLSATNVANPTFTADALAPGAEDATHVFSLIVTDDAMVASKADTVTITVVSAFVDPVAVVKGGNTQTVVSGMPVVLDGSGSTVDRRKTPLTYAWTRISGDTTVTLTGETKDMLSFTADTLAPDDFSVTQVFDLTVTDSTVTGSASKSDTTRVTVTVTPPEPPNVLPIAVPGPNQTILSGTNTQINANMSYDPDNPEGPRKGIATWIWWRHSSGGGALLLHRSNNNPHVSTPTKTVRPGEDDDVSPYYLIVIDEEGAECEKTIKIGTSSRFACASLTVTTTAPPAPPVANAGPDQPVDGQAKIDPGDRVTLAGSGMDADGTIATYTYTWMQTGGATVDLTGENTAAPSFTAGAVEAGAPDVIYEFTLTVTDADSVVSEPDTVMITVTAPFAPTVADAGENREVASGTVGVELDGSGSTSDRRFPIGEYEWKWTSGTGGATAPALTNADMAKATFTADTLMVGEPDVTHTFTLTVTDSEGDEDTDMVTITVEAPEAPNIPPVAHAGNDRTIASGAPYILDGSRSTDDDAIENYIWTYPGGMVTRETDQPSALMETAPVLAAGREDRTLVYTLTVVDNDGARSEPATVTFTVNAPPEANAGPDQGGQDRLKIDPGNTVMLDGSGSNDSKGIVSYSWDRTGGTEGASATLSAMDVATPTFTAGAVEAGAADVTHVFTLTVMDAEGAPGTDTVTITVTAPFAATVADAGPDQTVDSEDPVTLDGSGSIVDRRRTPLSYAWERTTGGTVGATVTLTGANTVRPSFTADTLAIGAEDVTHVFTLTVTDKESGGSTDTVEVTVRATQGPTGRFEVIPESHDGATPIRMAVVFSKEVRGFTASDLVADADSAGGSIAETRPVITNFRKDPGNALRYTFTVTPRASVWFSLTIDGDGIEDLSGNRGQDFSTGQINYANAPPVADAGLDRTVNQGEKFVILDGSGSTDSNGTVASYSWTNDSGVILTGADTARPSFTADTLTAGDADVTHVFSLVVTDNDSAPSTPDTVMVTVTATQTDFQGPSVVFVEPVPDTHDGMSSFELQVEFNEPVVGFTPEDIILALERRAGETDAITSPPVISNFRQISNLGQTPNVQTNYAFTLTPKGPVTFTVKLNNSRDSELFPPAFQDLAGNSPSIGFARTYTITYRDDGNNLPIANAGLDQTVRSGVEVTLDGGMSSDPGGSLGAYTWTRTGGTSNSAVVLTPGNTITGANVNAESARARFTADTVAPGADDVTHIFELVVTDNLGADSIADTVTVTITPPNVAPEAHAGDDKMVASGTIGVILDGSRSSDIDGMIASYSWTSDSGVTLTGADTAMPTFTADTLEAGAADVTHTFTLIVTDTDDETSADTVVVTVASPNAPPVAVAGKDLVVLPRMLVTLDGSKSSDIDGTVTAYAWTRKSGSGNANVALTGANTARLSFTADALADGAADVTHIFELVVTDDEDADSVAAMVTVTVTSGNAPPVADAGADLMVHSGETVTLVGSGTDIDDDDATLNFAWARTGGTEGVTAPTLTNGEEATASFKADTVAAGAGNVTHIFTLTVTDDETATGTDTVTITVTPPNVAPIADAGEPRTVAPGTEVTLDGRGSKDDDGTVESYAWTVTDRGSAVALTDANTVRPGFTAATLADGDPDVTYVFQLIVTDNDDAESAPVTVTVTVKSLNVPPVANAGPDQLMVPSGSEVTLDGRGSTVDDRSTISYAWTRTGGTSGVSATLNDASAEQPTFTANDLVPGAADETHVFTLTVTDDAGTTARASVMVTVISPFAPPVVRAGDDQRAGSEETVTLVGSATTDFRRSVKSWEWTRTGGNDALELTGANTPRLSFKADALSAGDPDVIHEFTLTVTDDDDVAGTDTVMVTVSAAPPDRQRPTGAFLSPPTLHDGKTPFTMTVEFNEPVEGFDIGDILTSLEAQPGETEAAKAPTISDFKSILNSLTHYTFTVTPRGPVTIRVRVAADSYQDLAGNPGRDFGVEEVIQYNGGAVLPVANAGMDQTVNSGTEVTLDGSGSTSDHSIDSWNWMREGGTPGATAPTLTDADTDMPKFTVDLVPGAPDVIHIFRLIVADELGNQSAPDTVTVRITAPIAAPVANAGRDFSVDAGTVGVQLDGSGSTADRRRTLDYFWGYAGGTGDGSSVLNSLFGAGSAKPTFTAETREPGALDVYHDFTLRVKYHEGGFPLSDPSKVRVTVTSPIKGLVANAGASRTVASGTMVELDGSGSTKDRRSMIFYDWKRTGGTLGANVALTSAKTVNPTFTANDLAPGADDVTHVFTLTVMDDQGSAADTATVTITVTAPIAGPVADAGPKQTVKIGETVTLDGSGSTVDRRKTPISYAWTRMSGTGDDTVTLTNENTAKPTFTADTLRSGSDDVTHVFKLTVTDREGVKTDSDTVTITVTAPVAATVARAGPDQTVDTGATVRLDGDGSTVDRRRTITSYAWARTGGTEGATVTPMGANTARPTFTADTLTAGAADVTHTFTLTVTDSDNNMATDSVTVTVKAPRAITGPTSRFEVIPASHDGRTPIRLAVVFSDEVRDFTASDLVAAIDPAGGSIAASRPVITNFRKDPGNALRYTFTVTPRASVWFSLTIDGADFEGLSGNPGQGSSTGQINYVNVRPIADAGGDRTVVQGEKFVILDGSGSSDPNGTVASYAWTRTGGTSTNTVTLFGADVNTPGANTAMPSFTADTLADGAGNVTHTFQLIVTDNEGAMSVPAMVTVTVTANPADMQGPTGLLLEPVQNTHDGMSSFELEVEFNEPVVGFTPEDIILALERQSGEADRGVSLPVISNFRQVSNLRQTLNVQTNYKFTLTPQGPVTFTVKLNVSRGSNLFPSAFQDLVGNRPIVQSAPTYVIRYNVNTWPIADAGPDQTVRSGAEVTLDGGMSEDPGGTIGLYTWTRTGGTSNSAVVLTKGNEFVAPNLNAESARARFTADTVAPGADDVTHIFELVVTDNLGADSIADTVTVTITPPNVAPVAHAGDDQTVASGTTGVTLDGSRSLDFDGEIAFYSWTSDSGVTLTGANTAMPSFTADTLEAGAEDVTHVFELIVTDDEAAVSVADTVTVTVTSANAPPVADAGADLIVSAGTLVTLDGSGSSDIGGTVTAWRWARTGGTGNDAVALTGKDMARLSFTADTLADGAADVTHIFELVVTDDENAESVNADTVMVTVTAGNVPPVADAGADLMVHSGETVTLVGSGTDIDDDDATLNFAWARTGGTEGVTAPTLTNGDEATASFKADTVAAGADNVTHEFTLTVTDDENARDTDTVTVTVTPPNVAPDADAGDDLTVDSGEMVTLDGRSSMDNDGTVKSYAWTLKFVIGNGSIVALTGANTAEPSFTAETLTPGAADVAYVFQLIVMDNDGVASDPTDPAASVRVTVESPNIAPVANAGLDQDNVAAKAIVTLDGSGSTVDDRSTISHAWTRTGGTSGVSATLSDASAEQPTFTANDLRAGAADVTHVFTLKVTDDAGNTDTDTVMVTVISPFAKPLARAGDDLRFGAGELVTIDGSGSRTDRRRPVKSYSWTRTDKGTSDENVELTGANTARLSFRADTLDPGDPDVTHIFELVVTDTGNAVSDPDTVVVTVSAAPPDLQRPAGDFVSPPSAHDGTTPFTMTVEFNEDVMGFAIEDIRASLQAQPGETNTARSPTISDFKSVLGGSRHYTFTVTPRGPVSIRVRVVDNSYQDLAGNLGRGFGVEQVIRYNGGVALPVANAGPDQRVDPGATVTLDGRGSTSAYPTIMSWGWKRTGGTPGASAPLTGADTARPSFTAAAVIAGDPDEIHVFELVVVDDGGIQSTPDTVTVTITAPFADPVANAGGNQTVTSGDPVTLDGRGSTVDRRRTIKSYSWVRTGGTEDVTVSLTGADTNQLRFTADILDPGDPDVTHVFTLTVTDSEDVFDTDIVTITVTSAFKPLVANAGPDQPTVASGEQVTLDGSGTTHDPRRTIEFSWARTGGTSTKTVDLTDANTDMPTFTADILAFNAAAVTHEFTLTVTDSGSMTHEDTVTITVNPSVPTGGISDPIVAPVANAGPDQLTVASGTEVRLDGSGSTVDRRRTIKSYSWVRTGGTEGATVTLTGADTEYPRFTDTLVPGAEDVTHEFTLTVTDDADENDDDEVTIKVISAFANTVVDAGAAETVESEATVTLDGSGTKADRRALGVVYSWAFTHGTGGSVTLSDPTAINPTFTAATVARGAADVTHTFSLTVTTVTDTGRTRYGSATVTITVTAAFDDPVADAGMNREVTSGAAVILDGSGSTVDDRRTIKSWFWERTGGTPGASVTLTGETMAMARFTADTLADDAEDVTHIFRLTLTDSADETSIAMVTITVTPGNAAPSANAGTDFSVASGTMNVELDGSASMDSDGDAAALKYSWTGIDGTGSAVTLTGANTAKPTFTAETLEAGADDVAYVFTLTVTDDASQTDIDMVTVTVESPIAAPVADAGPDQGGQGQPKIDPGDLVTLDGSGSTVDRRRTPLTWSWTQLTGTGGGTGGSVTLSDRRKAQPTFTPPRPTPGAADPTYVFSLTVRDSANETSNDTVTITVTAPFAAPVAKAGPDQGVVSRATVMLDGRGSTVDRRRTLSHRWLQSGGDGATVKLSDENAEQPTFTAEILADGVAEVTYIFSLTVTDSEGAADTDTVTITVTPAPFPPPVANAGPDQWVHPGTKVLIDGSATTIGHNTGDVRFERYNFIRWGRIGGTSKVMPNLETPPLPEGNTFQRTFTADTLEAGDASVTHIFELWVQDHLNVDDRDTVTITVLAPLVADAGMNREVSSGTEVTLGGSRSTETGGGRNVTYAWVRTGGTESANVTLSDPAARQPTFTADILAHGAADVTHTFTLTVTDDRGSTEATDTVTITVTKPFDVPVADAGPDQGGQGQPKIDPGDLVTLDGGDSTVDDRSMISYAWRRTSGDATATLSGATTATPSFTAETLADGDPDATHVFELTVTDDAGQTATDTVTITITAPLAALVAEAGTGQTVDSGARDVPLDGTGSTLTGGGRTVTYLWTRTGGTGDSSVAPSDPAALQTSFTAETLNPGDADVTHISAVKLVWSAAGSLGATELSPVPPVRVQR